MKLAHSSNAAYQVGGCLPEDAPSYVARKADDVLYKSLLEGEFCNVLNSRQMGKSSLRVKTMKKLQEAGIACIAIDLTAIGTHKVTPEKWYGALIKIILNHFELREKIDFRAWLKERKEVTPVQYFCEFIEEILLVEVTQKIVIFIDEIDSVLRLEFKDDFFALIRACYNKRAEKTVYKRLSFVLLGVATPSDLINDKVRTPFNIGKAIELKGFQLDEVKPLIRGIEKKAENAQVVIEEVLYWTGGQPFLTQKVCQLVCSCEKIIPAGSEKLYINKLVKKHIIENWESQDEPEHLRTICNRIFRNEKLAGRLLGLYQKILLDGQIKNDDSYEQIILLLSGLVVKNGNLKPYNLIYKNVFNLNWVENSLKNLQPYSEAITAWLSSNCLDESRLLRGKALQEALDWAKNKSLSTQDYQFLSASQSLEKLELKLSLETADKYNDILGKAQQKARRTIRRGFAGFAVISFTTILVTLWGNAIFQDTQKKLELAKKDTQAAKQELKNTKYEAQELNSSLNNTKKTLDKIRKKKRDLEKRNKETTDKVESAEKRFRTAEENKNRIQHEYSKTKAELEQNYLEKDYINQELNKVNQEMSKAKKEIRKAKTAEQEARKQLQETTDEFKENRRKLERSTDDIEKLKRIVSKMREESFAYGGDITITALQPVNIATGSIHTVKNRDNDYIFQPEKNHLSIHQFNTNIGGGEEVKLAESISGFDGTFVDKKNVSSRNCTSADKSQPNDRRQLLSNLQKKLRRQDLDKTSTTGNFGIKTKLLIKRLQESKKLTAEGINCLHSYNAGIIPDSTLGTDSSDVLIDRTIKNTDRIDGGAVRGSNFFHSFKEFNIRSESSSDITSGSSFIGVSSGILNAAVSWRTGEELEPQPSIEVEENYIASGIFAGAKIPDAMGGNFVIGTKKLHVHNGDRITITSNTSANSRKKGGNILLESNAGDLAVNVPKAQSNLEINAGNLAVNADNIILNSQGSISLEAGSNKVKPKREQSTSNERMNTQDLIVFNAGGNIQLRASAEGESTINNQVYFRGEFISNSENKSVIELQKFLKDRGFYKGSLNGVWNTQTQKALDAFKRYYNID